MRYAKVVSRAKGEKNARIAKIYAEDFNKKDIPSTVAKIAGGTLIIEEAGDLSEEVVSQLSTAMEFRTNGLVIILEDEKGYLKELMDHHPKFAEKFTSAIDIPILPTTNWYLLEKLTRWKRITGLMREPSLPCMTGSVKCRHRTTRLLWQM